MLIHKLQEGNQKNQRFGLIQTLVIKLNQCINKAKLSKLHFNFQLSARELDSLHWYGGSKYNWSTAERTVLRNNIIFKKRWSKPKCKFTEMQKQRTSNIIKISNRRNYKSLSSEENYIKIWWVYVVRSGLGFN